MTQQFHFGIYIKRSEIRDLGIFMLMLIAALYSTAETQKTLMSTAR